MPIRATITSRLIHRRRRSRRRGCCGWASISASPARNTIAEPYLSTSPKHEGLLLHSVYHRPNNWDYIPPGKTGPCGESSLWGDYHLLELCVYLKRLIEKKEYLKFFD